MEHTAQHPPLFAEVLEAIERLSFDEQEAVAEILRRRLADQGRRRIVAEVREARREFEAGRCRTGTVDEIMHEIRS